MTWARQEAALGIAAKSVLASRKASSTVHSVVAERVLEHQWHSLAQYAVRHVGPALAQRLLADLEALSATDEGRVLFAPFPGPRARIVRWLREAMQQAAQHDAEARPLPASSPLFLAPRLVADTGCMIALREALPSDLGETIELVHTRGLRVGEAAFVLNKTPEQIEEALAEGRARAVRLLGAHPPSRTGTIRGALMEAFALDERRAPAPARPVRPPLLQEGDVIADRYEIEERLGAGAFAEVYRARDLEVSDHVVALKILRAQSEGEVEVANALRELQLIASVFHPSIVQLKDHGWYERHLWFVMPLYRGETLAQRIRRKALTREEARAVFEPLARALAVMHRAGVRHQDVKPENVFLARLDLGEGEGPVLPVLLDLGVAARDAELVLAGTPTYFAPEVAARFAGDVDPPLVGPKSDVFSLALTLRDALEPEGADPLIGGSVDAFVALRATAAPSPPARSDLAFLAPSMERWMHISPDMRPGADQLASELAVLTAPEEKRARRVAFARWAVPSSMAVLALYGAVAYVLTREADVQRLEAEQARAIATEQRQRADRVSANLNDEEARRRAVEEDVTRLEELYESSRLTREQLAERLAHTESSLVRLEADHATQTTRLVEVTSAGNDWRIAVERQVRELEERRNELNNERARRERVEERIREIEAQLAQANAQGVDASGRIDSLETELRTLQAAIARRVPPPPMMPLNVVSQPSSEALFPRQ